MALRFRLLGDNARLKDSRCRVERVPDARCGMEPLNLLVLHPSLVVEILHRFRPRLLVALCGPCPSSILPALMKKTPVAAI